MAIIRLFKNILKRRDANNCISIDEASDWVILEVIRFDKSANFDIENPIECKLEDADYIFGRIGKKGYN